MAAGALGLWAVAGLGRCNEKRDLSCVDYERRGEGHAQISWCIIFAIDPGGDLVSVLVKLIKDHEIIL